MTNDNIIFIGMDTHKEFCEIAYARDERTTQAEHYGRIKTTKAAIIKFAKQMQSKYPQATLDFVPEPEDEAVRDLSRARERAMNDLCDAKYQLKALLLRNNINYDGKANWSLKHLRWLTEMVLPHPAQQFVLQEAVQTVTERMKRLARLDNELTAIAREMIAFIWSISREVVLSPVNPKLRLSRVLA